VKELTIEGQSDLTGYCALLDDLRAVRFVRGSARPGKYMCRRRALCEAAVRGEGGKEDQEAHSVVDEGDGGLDRWRLY
jgi:hypothetical protein